MDVRHKALTLAAALLAVLTLGSCDRHSTRFDDDVSADRVPVEIDRFDKAVLELGRDTAGLRELYGRYGEFFMNLYAYEVLSLPNPSALPLFVNDSNVNVIYAEAERQYADAADVEEELTGAFAHFRHYFPNKPVPEFRFHVSGFNQNVILTDSIVSASIDLYLGADYEHYQGLVNRYELPLMDRSRLAFDMAYAWVSTEFPLRGYDRLIDEMLGRGRLLYVMMVLFPEKSEAFILGYGDEQYEWAERYEANIWASMQEKKQLFSSDRLMISQMVNPAPFTQGFSQDSPGRLGEYIGLKIVQSLMEKNKHLSLQAMFGLGAEELLRLSRYRP